jgi:hypothetical protein
MSPTDKEVIQNLSGGTARHEETENRRNAFLGFFLSAHSICHFSWATILVQGGLNTEKYITDERTGLKYELVGDYYLIAGEDKSEERRQIGIWGQRRLRYLKQSKKAIYTGLLLSGKLTDYLTDLDDEAEAMFQRLVSQLAASEGVTEELKAADQMLWVQQMNNIRNKVMEIINQDIIYG